jgi:hypothetical protein
VLARVRVAGPLVRARREGRAATQRSPTIQRTCDGLVTALQPRPATRVSPAFPARSQSEGVPRSTPRIRREGRAGNRRRRLRAVTGKERGTMTYRTTTTSWIAYEYIDPAWANTDITGYMVEALDGEIGKVDRATSEMGKNHLILNTGPWIFGKKVMLPAGIVSRIDEDARRVYVNRTKEQIKNAPELDESYVDDTSYHDKLGTYYAEGSPGWRDPVHW